jgi:hypothetical protein
LVYPVQADLVAVVAVEQEATETLEETLIKTQVDLEELETQKGAQEARALLVLVQPV